MIPLARKNHDMKVATRLLALTQLCVIFAFAAICPAAHAVNSTYGTLLSYDFDTNSWPGALPTAVGTIDVFGSSQPSGGLASSSSISSGPIAISNNQTMLGKLTLAFSLSASSALPVTVTVQSYDANQVPTGALQTLVYPSAPNFYQRCAVDLSTMQPYGSGTFQPTGPYVGFTFSLQDQSWQGALNPQIDLDDVNYAVPAYYVSATGSDSNTGRTEQTAFATPQKALNVANPGDIVAIMSGTYIGGTSTTTAQGGTGSVASFTRPGTPAAWIVLKNYPGQTPTLFSNGWNMINIALGSNGNISSAPSLAYIEIRGLHIRGQGDVVGQLYPSSIGQVDSRSNSNGIAIDGRFMANLPHHIRIADNVVEYCPGAGIGSGEADWITIEGNTSRNNCWTTMYAGSGITLSGASNFDTTNDVYKDLIRNNISCGNQTFQPWSATGKISDGNGIILDVNQHTSTHPNGAYMGRTLVQTNLSYNNGGSGIHSYSANQIDIIGNTAYLNSASPALQYGEIFANYSNDVRMIDNIMVAPVANISAGQAPESINSSTTSTNVVFAHNLYFGGNVAPTMGAGDVIGDPLFVDPSIDPTVADFHVKSASPAIQTGIAEAFAPYLDLDGKPRGITPDKGVYERGTSSQSITLYENTPTAIVLTGSGEAPFTFAVTTNPIHGTLTGTAPNLTYTPNLYYHGTDSFVFQITDITGDVETATVTLTILYVNHTPTATSVNLEMKQNNALPVTLTGNDVDGNSLTYTVISQPSNGALAGSAPNLTYTPTFGYVGSDSFAFKVNDGTVDSLPGIVTITIDALPVAGISVSSLSNPTASGSAATFDATVTGTAPSGIVTFYDGATIIGSGAIVGGVATVTTSTLGVGSHSMTASYVGDASNGGNTSSALQQNVEGAPTANTLNSATLQNAALPIILTGSDSNTPVLPLKYSIVTPPSHGTLSGTPPTVTYTPASGYSGADSFTFTVNNGYLTSSLGTVSITVTPVSPKPTLSSVSPSTIYAGVTTPQTLTISGTNFTASSVVVWNGTPLPTTYVSSTSLTSSVATSLLTMAGSQAVAIVTPGPGGGTSGSKTVKVALPTVTQIWSPSKVYGGTTAIVEVRLNSPAPANYATTITDPSPGVANVPATCTFSVGATIASMSVPTVPVPTNVTVNMTATGGGKTVRGTLVVEAPVVSKVAFSPSSVSSGAASIATVTLGSPAPSGYDVSLANSAPSVATIPGSVIFLAGATTATVDVSTVPVSANVSVTLTASANGVSKSATLTVKPVTK